MKDLGTDKSVTIKWMLQKQKGTHVSVKNHPIIYYGTCSIKPLIFQLTQLHAFIYEQPHVSVLTDHHQAMSTMS
jgi:hypothetical protein